MSCIEDFLSFKCLHFTIPEKCQFHVNKINFNWLPLEHLIHDHRVVVIATTRAHYVELLARLLTHIVSLHKSVKSILGQTGYHAGIK